MAPVTSRLQLKFSSKTSSSSSRKSWQTWLDGDLPSQWRRSSMHSLSKMARSSTWTSLISRLTRLMLPWLRIQSSIRASFHSQSTDHSLKIRLPTKARRVKPKLKLRRLNHLISLLCQCLLVTRVLIASRSSWSSLRELLTLQWVSSITMTCLSSHRRFLPLTSRHSSPTLKRFMDTMMALRLSWRLSLPL